MSDQANWRTDVNSSDYFGQQKKTLAVADRRPVIRKPSDLVGPGIAATAVRITDFNDLLATYNGFFSAQGDAANRPSSVVDTDELVGYVVSDGDFGGEQVFTRLSDGSEFRRRFIRAPYAPESITFFPWREDIYVEPDPLEGVWQTPTLLNGWVNYGAGFAAAQYMKKSGVLNIKGLVKSGTLNSIIFNMPAAYRPSENRILTGTIYALTVGPASGAVTAHTHNTGPTGMRLDVGSNGDVGMGAMSSGSAFNTWFSIEATLAL